MKPLNFEPYVDKLELGESKEEMEFEPTEGRRENRNVREARRKLRNAKIERRQSRRWWPRWGWRSQGWRPLRRGPSTTCDLGSFLCGCLAATVVANELTPRG